MEVETATLNLMDTVQPGCDPLLTTVTEQQLEAFLIKMIPEIDIFQRMHESFTDFYAYTAVQKFVFFLDTRKTNALSIKRLAHSKEMEELQAIRRLALQMSNNTMTVQEAEMEVPHYTAAIFTILALLLNVALTHNVVCLVDIVE